MLFFFSFIKKKKTKTETKLKQHIRLAEKKDFEVEEMESYQINKQNQVPSVGSYRNGKNREKSTSKMEVETQNTF